MAGKLLRLSHKSRETKLLTSLQLSVSLRQQSMVYLTTYLEWDREILGPIRDTMDVEQGCCASARQYKLVNND